MDVLADRLTRFIAIMSVRECSDVYLLLSDRVFQKKRHRVTIKSSIYGRFDSEELERAVKEVTTAQGLQKGYAKGAMKANSLTTINDRL